MKKVNYSEFEDFFLALDWAKAESVTIFDTELKKQVQHLRSIIADLNYEETEVRINKEQKIKRYVNSPLFHIRLDDRSEFSFYCVSGPGVIRFVKVILFSLFICITFRSKKESDIFLTCKGGSIFFINRKINKNLPELINEPPWVRLKSDLRLIQNTLKRLFSLNGFIMVKRDV